jgi:hypothetical protein
MKLEKICVFVSLLFWPVSLYLNNTHSDFISYLIPLILLIVYVILDNIKFKLSLLPLIFIPFLSPKLSLLPILICLFSFLNAKKTVNIIFLSLSVALIFFKWDSFSGQTIFVPDYQEQQKVIRDTHLYKNIFIARLFHNKVKIITDKFNSNVFSIIDLNNYIFGFHPNQIIGNQNLIKFPFIALFPTLLGFYYLGKNPKKRVIIILLISSILSLSILSLYDRNDFIIYLPLSLIFIGGANIISQKKYSTVFWIVYTLFSVTELIRIFV